MLRNGLLCLVLVATGACTKYSVRRSILAPNPAATSRTGQPLDGNAELHLGTANLVETGSPTLGGSSDAGIHVPRVDLNGAIRLRVGSSFDVGLVYDEGFLAGATSVRPDQPTPDGDVRGGGISMMYSARIDPSWRIGITTDFLIYSIPYVEYRTATNCCNQWTDITYDNVSIPVVSLGVIPSWHEGRWTIFGGLTMRNHPTTKASGVEYGPNYTDEVQAGPFNFVASAGAEVTLGGGVRVMLQVYEPLTSDPVAYLPTVALNVAIPLSRRAPLPPE